MGMPPLAPEQMRDLLRGAAARERSSARLLRAVANDAAAVRAERAASRIDLMLDQPQTVHRMHAFARRLSAASHHLQLLERALDGGVSLLGADSGEIQLSDPGTGALRIVIQTGLAVPASEVRQVHSTPLVDTAHRVRGILSAQFHHAHRPSDQALQIMVWYGELAGAAMTAQQSSPMRLYAAAAACHEHAAERHEATASAMRACAQSLSVHGSPSRAIQAQLYAVEAQTRARNERRRGHGRRRLIAAPDAPRTTGPPPRPRRSDCDG